MTATLAPLALLMAAHYAPVLEPADLSLRVKENDAFRYEVNVAVQSNMGPLTVVFNDVWKVGKTTEKGFAGSRSWLNTQLDFDGQMMDSDDEAVEFSFGKDGQMSNVSGDTEGMLIRLHPYFMFYSSEKPVEAGESWERAISMKVGNQEEKLSCKGKFVGIKEVGGEKVAEVEVSNEGYGSAPITAKGSLLISMKTGMPVEGKYEFKNVSNSEMTMDGVLTFKTKK